MRSMKTMISDIRRILAAVFAAAAISCLGSCSWLDIQPADTMGEDDLFETGAGYRNALNGIYLKLASTSLYGRELTYGMTEALAHTHEWSMAYKNNLDYQDVASYNYTTNGVKNIISGIWSTAYNTIANCNNLIDKISVEAGDKFAEGETERDLIHGEALAARAFCHFLIMSYFAPAPALYKADEEGKFPVYLPYYSTFSKEIGEYMDIPSFTERIVEDLKAARELVGKYDLQDNLHTYRLMPKYRFTGKTYSSSYPQPSDIFFAFRGYRLNYYAITAILARVYDYAGDYQNAVAEARTVIDATSPGGKLFSFTSNEDAHKDYKLSSDLIFGLSKTTLIDDYGRFRSSGTTLQLNSMYAGIISSSTSDYRWNTLVQKNTEGNSVCARYTVPSMSGDMTSATQDILPVIRLSEMYYILAEKAADDALYARAADYIEEVQVGRSAPENQLSGKISDDYTFKKEFLADVRLEFIEEGRIFLYCKKLDVAPNFWDSADSFRESWWYFPIPENETIF